MFLNNLGKIADSHCKKINKVYNDVSVEIFKVMPNHIHLILRIYTNVYSSNMKLGLVSTVIKSLKSSISKKIKSKYDIEFEWQRSFYDHIIRNEQAYNKIKSYIQQNELKWLYESKIPRN